MIAVLHHGEVSSLIVCLLVVTLVASFVWLAGVVLKRPDIGNPAALLVAIVGAILCLLD